VLHTDRRETTDGRATAYSERDREFTFAKNRCTDRDAVWVVDSGGPKEACIRRESRSPLKGQLLGERGGPLYKYTDCLRELCKNDKTDRDVVWDMDLGGYKEARIRWGCTLPQPGEYD